MPQIPVTRDEMIERIRKVNPDWANEIEDWECPVCPEEIGFGPEPLIPCGRVMSITKELGETYVKANSLEASRMLAHGIDPGYPQTHIQPVSYDISYTCDRGHKVFVRKQFV